MWRERGAIRSDWQPVTCQLAELIAMETIKLTPWHSGAVRENVKKQLWKNDPTLGFLWNYDFHSGCRSPLIPFKSYIFMIHNIPLPSSHFFLQVSFRVKFVFAVRSQEGQAYRLLANCLDKLNAPEEELDGVWRIDVISTKSTVGVSV